MTINKAKRYKTARLIPEAWEIPAGFRAGEYVAVKYINTVWRSRIFQCTNAAGFTAAISDFQLDSFVL